MVRDSYAPNKDKTTKYFLKGLKIENLNLYSTIFYDKIVLMIYFIYRKTALKVTPMIRNVKYKKTRFWILIR